MLIKYFYACVLFTLFIILVLSYTALFKDIERLRKQERIKQECISLKIAQHYSHESSIDETQCVFKQP